ncbi:YoaK family protein [Sphingomonas segetis]|jgi:uncharacterized membrane protein YoaK (UPF0700 family)|uniref:YoaK family protein n=1 Tax=Sphingomonas segetis TaxID=1104779 RepID=UPI0012D2ACAE|nr:YoaK family protein [Sphingomonas segetis]
MTKLEARSRIFACALATLAGFIDAVGFIRSGGFFVSFMSGNSTRLGVGFVQHLHDALVGSGLVVAFVAGVVMGSLAGEAAGGRRQAAVLAIVAMLLGLAAFLDGAGHLVPALALLALGMGAVNTVFEREGEVRVGVTYMTGGLVRVGTGLASTLRGRGGGQWPIYLLLWLSFVAGTVSGALAYGPPPNLALAAAAVAALLLAALSLRTIGELRP